MGSVDLMESSQRALHIATLVLNNGSACDVEKLQQKCYLFPVSSPQIHELCALPRSPLQALDDNKIGLTKEFLIELRSRLDTFEGACNGAAPRCGGATFLVPAVPSASVVAAQPVKDGGAQELDTKEKSTIPRRIPEFQDYVVLGEEGSGGYGTVYRVRRKRDNQLFAIKCPLEKTTPEYVNHEIKMLQKVGGQEYITRCEEVVHEVPSVEMEEGFKENQRPNLVLRYVEHDKPEVLRKEITIQELQLYGYCLFRALAYLHKQGIVHRDVKPGNFLFSRTRGTGYLVDFNLALVAPAATLASGKIKRVGCKPLKVPSKAESAKDLRAASSKNMLGKRVRKDTEITPSKRHQSLNIRELQAGVPCNNKSSQAVTLSRHPDRGTISPVQTEQPSVAAQCTALSTTNLNPRGAISTPGEESSKKSTAVDSSSKAPVVCDPVVPTQRLRQSRRSLKPTTAPKEEDNGRPESVLGDLAWMPPTVGVLRFAQYIKNRNPAQTSTVAAVPPASQRKRVAAVQDKKSTTVRLPVSPPRPSTKGAGVRRHLPVAKDGPCAGTKGYRAPEVLLKSNLQTTKLDIWSAGVSLLQLIAGKAPFPSSSSEQALRDIAKLRGVDDLLKLAGEHDCLHKLPPAFETLNFKPLTISDWCSGHARRSEMRDRLPPNLCDLLEKCLQVDPNRRIEASEALSHEFFKSVEERVAHDLGFSPPIKYVTA
ncbi:hypothetical protein M758_12G064100 [Ceratodon purpureus]|nr:hypothetical protein M758_12G064100 [Ceratodon purpureus]